VPAIPRSSLRAGVLKQFGDARMSGSGASVFLECDSEAEAQRVFALKPGQVAGFVAQGWTNTPARFRRLKEL